MPKLYGGPGPRTIHPSMRTSRSLARCSVGAQLLFDRMIIAADDQGRLLGDPVLVKAETMPLAKHLTLKQVTDWLDELVVSGMVIRYQTGDQMSSQDVSGRVSGGEIVLQLASWHVSQSGMRRAYPSRWPAPYGWTDRVFGLGSDFSGIPNGSNVRAERGQNAGTLPAERAQFAPSRAPAEPNRTEPNPAQPREREHARETGPEGQEEDGFSSVREPLAEKLKQLSNGHAGGAQPPSPPSTSAAPINPSTPEVDPDE